MRRDRRVGFTSGETVAAQVGDYATVQWVFPNGGQVNGWNQTAFTYWWLWPERADVWFDAGIDENRVETAFHTAPTSVWYRSGWANRSAANDEDTIVIHATGAFGLSIEIAPGGSIIFQGGFANAAQNAQIWGWEFSNEEIQQKSMHT